MRIGDVRERREHARYRPPWSELRAQDEWLARPAGEHANSTRVLPRRDERRARLRSSAAPTTAATREVQRRRPGRRLAECLAARELAPHGAAPSPAVTDSRLIRWLSQATATPPASPSPARTSTIVAVLALSDSEA